MANLNEAEKPAQTGVFAAADRFLVGLAALAIGAIAIYIMVAIAGSVFRFEVWDELLIVSEAMLVVIFLPMAVLIRTRGFIEVDALAGIMPERVQRRLDYLSMLFGLIFFSLLAWAAWTALERSWSYGDVHMGNVELPQWIGRAVLLFGVLGGLVAQIVVIYQRLRRNR